jgi:hypothetical protein
VRAIALFGIPQANGRLKMQGLGMDAEGIPVLLAPEVGGDMEPQGLRIQISQIARQAQSGSPLVVLDEETARRLNVGPTENQPYLIELAPESVAGVLRQLDQGQLLHAMRGGAPVEVRHHGERYILKVIAEQQEPEELDASMRMAGLKELKELTSTAAGTPSGPTGAGRVDRAERTGQGEKPAGGFEGLRTNVPAERLLATTAIEWIVRARTARAAFSPVQIVMGSAAAGEGMLVWRNHQNLQFLTHWLRCHLHAQWKARGETRPVEEVLRDLQEVHRATLTVGGLVVRRLATHPSKATAGLLTKLNLWELFESLDNGCK